MFFIYIIKCEKDRLYTGVTKDYKRRFLEHKGDINKGKGAKFTRSFKPKEIVALFKTNTYSDALKLEYKIKKLDKKEKEDLIADNKLLKMYFKDVLNIKKYKSIKM